VNERYELTAGQQDINNLNERLAAVAGQIRDQLDSEWQKLTVIDHFFITQFGKAQRTFLSIHLLLRESLIEDALCLLRVLVENTINLQYGIHSNAVEVVRRYWDWAMLDTVRRARASDWFKGTPIHSEARTKDFLKAEAEIRGRYSAEDFESLKRSVFGISLERRADVAGLRLLYDASYRVLSRNVHAMDVAVMEISRKTSSAEDYADLLESRATHLLDIAQWCLGTLAIWVNGQFGCGFDEELKYLQSRS
jgi:Family of unknown function (DUF5677)